MKKTKPLGQAAPLTVDQVKMITTILRNGGETRDLALFRVAIDSMLRLSDILKLQVSDVTTPDGAVVSDITIRQRKTGDPVTCQFGDVTRASIDAHLKTVGGSGRLFSITPRQFQRLVKKWVSALRIDPERYSPHSLRRTKAALVYAKTKNVEACRQLLGHASVAATSAYLGVSQNEAFTIAKEIDL